MAFNLNTDEENIILYKNGESEAFKFLINKYTPPLYNFIRRFAGSENAEDVVQEAFIKTWKNINKFETEKASFKTWIFTIAKNTLTDFLRKKRHINFSDIENVNEDNSFTENIPDENLLPDEVLQKLEDSEKLNKVLKKLSINYQTILTLHYQEEMTFDEIGKILNKSTNTVKSQHYRAILSLRKIIEL